MTHEKPKPFADGETAWSFGGISVENGPREIAVFGDEAFRKDRVSLRRAENMRDFFAELADVLRQEEELPENAGPLWKDPEDTADNPFF